jgi:hypothetical protein
LNTSYKKAKRANALPPKKSAKLLTWKIALPAFLWTNSSSARLVFDVDDALIRPCHGRWTTLSDTYHDHAEAATDQGDLGLDSLLSTKATDN